MLMRETRSVGARVGGTEGEQREWKRVSLFLLFILVNEEVEAFPCENIGCLLESQDLLLCNETCCDITRSVTVFESVLSRLEC